MTKTRGKRRTRSGRRLLIAPVALAIGAIGLLGPAAHAQFQQYTAPGSLAAPRVTTREAIKKALEEARWRLGPVRVQPWIGVRDAAYVHNVFDQPGNGVNDYTVTAGAGLFGYLPVGPKLVIATQALPELVQWRNTTALDTTAGRYGAGVFGFFNRLTVETQYLDVREQSFISDEREVPANIHHKRGDASFELRLSGSVALFAGGSTEAISNSGEPGGREAQSALDTLDRHERTLRGGLRFTRPSGLTVSVGVESSAVDFDLLARDRSNHGTSPLLEVEYEGPHWSVGGSTVYRELEPRGGESSFQPYHDVSGRVRLAWKPRGRFTAAVYATQQLVYTVSLGSNDFTSRIYGVALEQPLNRRLTAHLYAETGSNDYRVLNELNEPSALPARSDRYQALGFGLAFELRAHLRALIDYTWRRYDSNRPGLDRTFNGLQWGLSFGGSSAPTW